MRRKSLSFVFSSVAALAVMSGCDSTDSTEADAPAPAVSVSSVPAGPDEATTKACADLFASIAENDKKVAEAEKIGPPAGHIAVGAQYVAGSKDLAAKVIGATDAAVINAADQVGARMAALDEAWQKNPRKKPSETGLKEAIAELKTACGTD